MSKLKHDFYTYEDVKDASDEDKDSSHSTYYYVAECGFAICKRCGQAEGSLEKFCRGN